MTTVDDLTPPPDDSIVGTPARRPDSVRRTANINMVWPGGMGTPMQLRGRSRDLFTPADPDAAPRVLDEAQMVVDIGPMRTIEAITVTPPRPDIGKLVGAQGGSYLRSAIDEAVPGEREQGTPLHFLLDDIAGATLIAGFAWSQGRQGGPPGPGMAPPGATAAAPGGGAVAPGAVAPAAAGTPVTVGAAAPVQARTWGPAATPSGPAGAAPGPAASGAPQEQFTPGIRKGRVICSGLRPNGYMQVKREQGEFMVHFLRTAGDLASDDPWAWHEIEPAPEVCMRRRRRVDAWREDGVIVVDAHFRDSLWNPDHVELSLHEYTVQARIDPATHRLLDIEAVPRVLPFPECPWAAPHASMLVGHDVNTFRTDVQQTLTELQCCTHLNDMVRGLAEVSRFSAVLDA